MKIKRIMRIYNKVFPNYPIELTRVIFDCDPLLDVGCGNSSPVRYLPERIYKIGVDAYYECIDNSRSANLHHEYLQTDVLNIGQHFKEKTIDCVLASDLIEHLEKDRGIELLQVMETIAKKQVIIFTPNGYFPQGSHDNNPWQIHRSGWFVDEMRGRGYSVIGINGLKCLRGDLSSIRWSPMFFWRLLSDISQKYTRRHPKYAFQILCVKNLHE